MNKKGGIFIVKTFFKKIFYSLYQYEFINQYIKQLRKQAKYFQ